ncbi:MAG: hypothetical protein B7733_23555 [Myxococcales bacterium FL481]|nr:MAG: hypothetical protein B7733_23555 [Myxococcales bacterium FL481]
MVKTVKYKRPRKINPVSVSLAVAAAIVAYLTYQYLPVQLRKSEARRVLDETSSTFAGSKKRYLASPDHIETLRREMHTELYRLGLTDPEMETWIEVDSEQVIQFGVAYAELIEWPYDLIAPKLETVQVEYELVLK